MEHIELHGPARQMGRQHGRQLAGLIAQVIRQCCPGVAATPADARAAAGRIEATLQARCPNVVEELGGLAEAAGVPYEHLLLLHVQGDAAGDALAQTAHCTAIGLPNTSEGALIAKTDDVRLEERGFETFFHARPDDGYACFYYAFAGMLCNHGGINAAGLALVMTGLPPAGRRDPDGIPSLIFLREVLLRCGSVAEALAFAEAHPLRGYGCTMTLADATSGDVTVVENYPALRAMRRSSAEPTVRTNHPQCAESLALPADERWLARYGLPGLRPNSQARAAHAARLAGLIPRSVAGLQQLLGDHTEPGAICQHGQAGLHTSIAMILVPRRRALIAAHGYGCESYATYTLT